MEFALQIWVVDISEEKLKNTIYKYLCILWDIWPWTKWSQPDLEKAASGASSACGHFVEIHAILRTFWVKIFAFLIEVGRRRLEDGKLRSD